MSQVYNLKSCPFSLLCVHKTYRALLETMDYRINQYQDNSLPKSSFTVMRLSSTCMNCTSNTTQRNWYFTCLLGKYIHVMADGLHFLLPCLTNLTLPQMGKKLSPELLPVQRRRSETVVGKRGEKWSRDRKSKRKGKGTKVRAWDLQRLPRDTGRTATGWISQVSI